MRSSQHPSTQELGGGAQWEQDPDPDPDTGEVAMAMQGAGPAPGTWRRQSPGSQRQNQGWTRS